MMPRTSRRLLLQDGKAFSAILILQSAPSLSVGCSMLGVRPRTLVLIWKCRRLHRSQLALETALRWTKLPKFVFNAQMASRTYLLTIIQWLKQAHVSKFFQQDRSSKDQLSTGQQLQRQLPSAKAGAPSSPTRSPSSAASPPASSCALTARPYSMALINLFMFRTRLHSRSCQIKPLSLGTPTKHSASSAPTKRSRWLANHFLYLKQASAPPH